MALRPKGLEGFFPVKKQEKQEETVPQVTDIVSNQKAKTKAFSSKQKAASPAAHVPVPAVDDPDLDPVPPEHVLSTAVKLTVVEGKQRFVCNFTGRPLEARYYVPTGTKETNKQGAFCDPVVAATFWKRRVGETITDRKYNAQMLAMAKEAGYESRVRDLPTAPSPTLLDKISFAEYQQSYMPAWLLPYLQKGCYQTIDAYLAEKEAASQKRAASTDCNKRATKKSKKEKSGWTIHIIDEQGSPMPCSNDATLADLRAALVEEFPQHKLGYELVVLERGFTVVRKIRTQGTTENVVMRDFIHTHRLHKDVTVATPVFGAALLVLPEEEEAEEQE